MDSDCLVKLTKAGAKEAVALAMEIHIPPLVKKEIVDEGRELGYQDAFTIEENIGKKAVHVVKLLRKQHTARPAAKGEMEAITLYLEGGYDAIASDDRRFLKKLETANIPYLTPSACVIFLYKNGAVVKSEALNMIEELRLLISREEYMIARFVMEESL